MNPNELELHYPLGDTLPAPGSTLELAPGVRWIRMGLPFALDHINLWLLRDELDGREGWTVVDCCVARDEAKAQWEQIFATQLEGLPILRVIVTHMHPDHIGLAHWLCERWSTAAEPHQGGAAPSRGSDARSGGAWGPQTCRMWVSATDYNSARIATQSTTGFGGENAARFFSSHGLTDPEAVDRIRGRGSYYASMVPAVPGSFRRMQDGDTIAIGGRGWRCISGYGHAPEHISLYCDELHMLISGDMMLPRISTNISVHDVEPESNPLKAFLASIDKFRPLPAATLVLPSHGKPFTGLQRRIEQLHLHHRERLAELLQACVQRPLSAADALPLLFKRTLDVHQTTFAMGEAIAHLHALWFDGLVRREHGADGVWRFSASQSSATA